MIVDHGATRVDLIGEGILGSLCVILFSVLVVGPRSGSFLLLLKYGSPTQDAQQHKTI